MTAVYEPGGPASDWDDAPMCECGRGPILWAPWTPDCCFDCWSESLCAEHGEANCEECAS